MVITKVKIYTMAGEVIENGYIRSEGNIIAKVGDMADFSQLKGENVVDYTGCIAIPGLIDAHSHLGMFGDSLGFEGDDGNEMSDPITPQLRALDSVNCFDRGFSEAVDYGITTVLTGPGSANSICGQSLVIKTYGERIDDMIMLEPATMKMALGENPKGVYAPKNVAPTTRMAIAALIREELKGSARYMQDLEASLEDDELDPPDFDAKCEALMPVLKGELPVHFHAHRADDIFTAMRLIKEFNLKGVIVHATEGHRIAKFLAEEKIPVITGPILGTRSKPELFAACRESPAILAENGVELAICTDHPELPQDSLMLCAAIAHKAGLSAEKALEAVTITAAKISGVANRVGSIEKGKDFDVVIYENNPLAGLEKPLAVFINGNKVR